MNIIRAKHLGMCFGVRDAIALASSQAASEPVTILGQLVHNPVVLDQLLQQGVRVAQSPDEVTTPTAIITAHGASDRRINEAKAKGFRVIEATCPLVHVAHQALRKLVEEGYHPVVIGKRGHVEVRGLTEDLGDFDIVLSEDDVRELKPRPKFGVICQTTQPVTTAQRLLAFMRQTFSRSEIKFRDTICLPTKQRQQSAVELARKADVVVVIGGRNSNNTAQLTKTCAEHGAIVHQIENADDLQESWFRDDMTVGITAGTSTPDQSIDAAENWLRARFCAVKSEAMTAELTTS